MANAWHALDWLHCNLFALVAALQSMRTCCLQHCPVPRGGCQQVDVLQAAAGNVNSYVYSTIIVQVGRPLRGSLQGAAQQGGCGLAAVLVTLLRHMHHYEGTYYTRARLVQRLMLLWTWSLAGVGIYCTAHQQLVLVACPLQAAGLVGKVAPDMWVQLERQAMMAGSLQDIGRRAAASFADFMAVPRRGQGQAGR